MLQSRRQSDELSIAKSEHLSPNISPIYNAENNMLYEKVGHSSHLATQLDLTMDISMDNISLEKNQISVNDCEKLSGKLIFLFAACFSFLPFFQNYLSFNLFSTLLIY